MLNESQQLCLEMIQSVYTDGVDAIGEVVVDEDENLVVQFQDGNKLLEAKIYPERKTDDIEIKLVNPESVE